MALFPGVTAIFTFFLAAANAGDSNTCEQQLTTALRPKYPLAMVGHTIHSLTVRDLRRFFDPAATEINFIPTVNRDLSSDEPILSHAPDLRTEDDDYFLTDGMKDVNFVLSHMDDPNYDIKGYSPLEKIVHMLHMREMWLKIKDQLNIIRKTPPPNSACRCILDISNNGILEYLNYAAEAIRTKPKAVNATDTENSYSVYFFCGRKKRQAGGSKNDPCIIKKNEFPTDPRRKSAYAGLFEGVPKLNSEQRWKWWKKNALLREQGKLAIAVDLAYNSALFFYCSIEKAHGRMVFETKIYR